VYLIMSCKKATANNEVWQKTGWHNAASTFASLFSNCSQLAVINLATTITMNFSL